MDDAERRRRELEIEGALADRNWERGLELAEEYCHENPEEVQGLVWTTTCLMRLGRLAEALQAARNAVLLAPADAAVRELAARLERRQADRRPDVGGEPPTAPVQGASPMATVMDQLPGASGGLPARIPITGASAWPVGSLIEGRWEMRGSARGGMGEVLFVFDRELQRLTAVKTPHPEQLASEEGRARFVREAEAWIALGLHPNVCTAFFVHTIAKIPRLFIEYVDAGGLDDWLKQHSQASLEERLDIAIQLATGMHHAHTFAWEDEAGEEHRGVVHRDIKPGNVLIGHDGMAKVTDFGLVGRPSLDGSALPRRAAGPRPAITTSASGAWSTVTMGGTLMGTPPYMPPEQWDSAHLVGPKGDIYAFGCVLYELLCGRRPFELDPTDLMATPEVRLTAWEMLHRHAPPPDPRSLAPDLDGELAELARACLAKDGADRPASFQALRESLTSAYIRLLRHPYPRRMPEATQLQADSLNNQGTSYITLGQPRRAVTAWRRALAVHPSHADVSYNLALQHWRNGSTDAEAHAAVAELRRTPHPTGRNHLLAGRLALAIGELEAASEGLRLATETAPDAETQREATLALAAAAWQGDSPDPWRQVLSHLESGTDVGDEDELQVVLRAVARERLAAFGADGTETPETGVHEHARAAEMAARFIPGGCLRARITGLTGRASATAMAADQSLAAVVCENGRMCTVDPAKGDIVQVLRSQGPRPRCLAFHADGASLFVAEGDGKVAAWSLAKGAGERPLELQPGVVGALVVSRDGGWVVGLGSEGSLTIWEAASGRRVKSWRAHTGYGTCLALARGDRVVTGGSDGVIRVWELPSGRCLTTLDGAQGQGVTAIAAAGDLEQILSAHEDRRIRLWQGGCGPAVRELAGHGDRVSFLALLPSGNHAISASLDETLRWWDLGSGEPMAAIKAGGGVMAGVASLDLATVLLVHSAGATIADGRFPPTFRPPWALAPPLTVDATQERQETYRAAIAQAEECIRRQEWDGALEYLLQARTVAGFARAPEALALLASIQAHLPHDTLRDGWEERVTAAHRGRTTTAAVSADGKLAGSAGGDGVVALWRVSDGVRVWSLDEQGGFETAACFTPDGRHVLTGGLGHAVRLRDASSGRVGQSEGGHGAQITQVAVGRCGQLALSSSLDHTVRVWQLPGLACQVCFEEHRGPALAAALAPAERRALSADDTGTVLLWETHRGTVLGRLEGHDCAVTAVAFSPDGARALTADRRGVLRLFDLSSGHCLRTLGGEEGQSVSAVAFAPPGRFAASGGSDGAVRIWDLHQRRCLQTLAGHAETVSALTFVSSGHRLLSAAADGTLRLWYCEWQPAVREPADWDERALPYLEVFLQRHAERGWGSTELQALLQELRWRGLGWLRPDGIKRKLEELTAGWQGPLELAPLPDRPVTTRRDGVPGARGRSLRRWLAWAGAAAGALVVVGTVSLWRMAGSLRLDQAGLRRLQAEARLEQLDAPRSPAESAGCDRARVLEYVQAFREPPAHDLQAGDAAAACLEHLADPRSVAPLLDVMRSNSSGTVPGVDGSLPYWEARRVSGTLARMGDAVVPEIAGALDDPDAAVSRTAALALVRNASPRSVAALSRGIYDPEPAAREAVASVLRQLVATESLSVDRSFELLRHLATDQNPRTRRSVASALALFRGREARRVAEELAQDEDPEVRAAAEEALRSFIGF